MSDTIETPAAPEEPGDDLRSVIAAAYRASVAEPNEGQERNERGQFASQEAEDAPADGVETDQPEDQADEPEKPAIDPPQSWSADEKAIWSTLSDAAQAAIIRREKDIDRALSERAAETRDVQSLREVAEQHRADIAEIGVAPAVVLRNAVTWDRALRTDPIRALSAMAAQYGVDLSRLSQSAPTLSNAPVDAPNHELTALQQRIAQLEEATNRERQASTLSVIESFEKAKAPDGSLAHPYFADVKVDMGRLIAADDSLSLDEAYEKAVWANAGTREKMRAAEAAAEKAKAEAARKAAEAKAATARRTASVRDNGPPRNGTEHRPDGSVRSDILAAMREANARL